MSARVLELTVVRHGRTAWNADGRFQGASDVPLDETGIAQARALSHMLAAERFDAVIASDLSRARQTAEIIAAPHAIVPEVDARWRELRFGAWEGLTWSEIVERFPEAAERPAGGGFATPLGGESFADACARVDAALAALRARFAGGAHVLVATHAGVLHALLRVALAASESEALRVRFEPASFTRLHFAGDGPATIVSLNQTAETARNESVPS